MKTCPKCEGNHDFQTKLCRRCYIKEWKSKKAPRLCQSCNKMKVAFGTAEKCASCYQRTRSARLIGVCSDCKGRKSLPANGRCNYCNRERRRQIVAKIVCQQCGRTAPHFAKGVCRPCYTNNVKRRGKYGIEPAQYVAMVKDQRGLCTICEEPLKRQPHIDHCHETGMIRSLLCYKCNVGLGSFGDDPERLRAAAKYIEAHRARKVA